MKSFCARAEAPRRPRLNFPSLAIAARNNSTRREDAPSDVHQIKLTTAPDNAFHLLPHVFIA